MRLGIVEKGMYMTTSSGALAKNRQEKIDKGERFAFGDN